MAYETGTTSTIEGFFTALSDFLTDNGWTLHDNISDTDKVFFSSGASGNEAIYIRATDALGLLDGHLGYGKSMHDYFAENTVSDRMVVTFRAYQHWDESAHTGDGEATGIFGNFLWHAPGNSTPTIYSCPGVSGSDPDGEGNWYYGPIQNEIGYANSSSYSGLTWNPKFLNCKLGFYTCYRSIYSALVNGRAPQIAEVGLLDGNNYPIWASGWSSSQHSYSFWTPAYDGDTMYLYVASSSGSLMWQRYHPISRTWTALTNSPFVVLANSQMQGNICWDGGDYIYLGEGYYGTHFARYSISGNSWTSLTVFPTTWYYTQIFYAPASETGHAEDRVYAHTDGSNNVRYYKVGANTWHTASAAYSSSSGSSGCVANGYGKFFSIYPGAGRKNISYYDFIAHSNPGNILTAAADNYNGGLLFLRRRVTDLHINDGATQTYHFVCDADHFKIAVEHDDSKWFWIYAGKIDVYSKSEMALSTALSSTGSDVEVTLNKTLTAEVGDYLTCLDPNGSFQAQLEVSAVGTNSVTFTTVSVAIPSGSMIGEDPSPVGVFSDDAEMWFPTNAPLIDTYQSRTLHAGVSPCYDVQPLGRSIDGTHKIKLHDANRVNLGYSGDLGNMRTKKHVLLPLVVSQGRPELQAIQEIRGQFKFTYSICTSTYHSSHADGDTLEHEGVKYLVFTPTNGSPWGRDAYSVCIGPIE